MDLATLVPLVLQASIAMTVVALGLGSRIEDMSAAARQPGLIVRSLLAMHLIMPVAAVALATVFGLPPAVKIALVALALSPVPPMLPKKQLKAGGSSGYVLGLLVGAALASVVYVPLALEAVALWFGLTLHLEPVRVAKIVLTGVLAPLAVGMTVRRFAPAFAERVAGPLSQFATVLLALATVALLLKAGPGMIALLGHGTLAAFAAFIALGLAVGHLLGGPRDADRTALAFASASRHPGVALAIAGANFPDEKLVMPAVLLYLLAGIVLSLPYLRWRRPKA